MVNSTGRLVPGNEREQAAQFYINRRVKVERLRLLRRVLVLHVVGGAQVEKIGHAVLQHRHTSLQNIQTGIAAVDLRRGADERLHIADTVCVHDGVFGLLG